MATLPAEILSREEVEKLIAGCSPRCPTGLRNRALIAVMYRAGLRVSEALALMPKDVDEEAGTLRVLRGKGSKARTVGMDAQGFAMLTRWMERRKELANGHNPIFCTLDGGKMATAYVRNLMRRLGKKADIGKRVHAHGLRHTHACELAREGVQLTIISKQLGHSNVGTTSRYLDHLEPQQVVDAIRARTW